MRCEEYPDEFSTKGVHQLQTETALDCAVLKRRLRIHLNVVEGI
jgi:hypothetical protein